MAALVGQIPHLAIVDLPGLEEPDAGAAVSLLALSALPVESRRDLGAASMSEIARALNAQGITIAIRVPHSWAGDDLPHAGRSRNELTRLADMRRVVWIADAGVRPNDVGAVPDETIRLDPHRVPLSEEIWETYGPHAKTLAAALPSGHQTSPLVWRLAVGSVALGANLGRVAGHCIRPHGPALHELARLLGLVLHQKPEMNQAVSRFMQARRPIPREVALAVAGLPDEDAPLVTQCVGYGSPVRMTAALRTRLLSRNGRSDHETEAVHAGLASYHRTLDGNTDPDGLNGWAQTTAWLEKVHHLAHAGVGADAEWSAQQLPRPEFYWDRGRYYSVERGEFEQAASVYEACLERFPDDDYATHYLAYNLARAHKEPERSRAAFERAVKLSPDNPWWNRRHVEHLIQAGEHVEARRMWLQSLERIDPDGARVARDPWLCLNLHLGVAEAWLQSGGWHQSRAVLQSVSKPVLERATKWSKDLARLRKRLQQTERNERRRFDRWLKKQTDPRWLAATGLWRDLRGRVPDLPPPIAGAGEDGPRFAWSLPGYFIEIVVHADGRVDWYAKDRATGEDAGIDEPALWPASELLRWLELVGNG